MSRPPLESADSAVDIASSYTQAALPADLPLHPADMASQAPSRNHARASVADADSPVSLPAGLRRLERVFAQRDWSEPRALVQAQKGARARAIEMLGRAGSKDQLVRAALLVAAAELFGVIRGDLVADPRGASRLASELEDVLGLPRIALAREVMRAPELLTLSPSAAVQAELAMLTAFAPLRSASLWAFGDTEQVTCIQHVGEGKISRGAKALALSLLNGYDGEPGPQRLLVGEPVGRWRQPLAALVGSARPGMREDCRVYLAEAVPMLAAMLERDALLAGNAASERALVESSERKLTRLGFDLHDGPIQNVALLAEDLRLFARQLDGALDGDRHRTLLAGRLEDLDAQLAAVDVEMRRISNEVRAASVLLDRPFTRALRDVAHAFAARTDIQPRLTLEGDMALLSASQQIALLNIVHEALANIREHSKATEAAVLVSVNAGGVEAQISDNGCGFDLEPTLIRVARKGRLGLVAMHERVRLLGGQCRIDSRPGGPTVVSVALERWEPLMNDAQLRRISA